MFTDVLELKLTITAGRSFEIPGANVKGVKAEVRPYGHRCAADFWISEEERKDEFFPAFVKPDLMEAKIEITPRKRPEDEAFDPLILQGPVTEKALLSERTIENVHLSGNPVLYRHYRIHFADPAWVLWRQHFPCDLMVDKTLKDLIEAHRAGVSLDYQWPPLEVKHPINTLPLGQEGNEASFYDYVVWVVDALNGVWIYDAAGDTYTFSADKGSGGGAVHLDDQVVADLSVHFPETPRNSGKLLNAFSEDPRKQAIDQSQAKTGIRRDFIGRFPVASDFDARHRLETDRLAIREPEIEVAFGRFPLMTIRPGSLIQIAGYQWSSSLFTYNKTYRLRDLSLEAVSADPEVTADHNMDHARYNIDLIARMESQAEVRASLPPYVAPRFPLRVEGRIVSEQGEEKAETYQIYQDDYKQRDRYRVEIPLFENQQVIVPFEPRFLSGHFYFPAYKKERVLVGLDFHTARIIDFLDWRTEGRLPMETQGNHILFGKTPESKTSMAHIYVDEKPQFNVNRVSGSDKQLFRITEGGMILETKEE